MTPHSRIGAVDGDRTDRIVDLEHAFDELDADANQTRRPSNPMITALTG